MASGVELKEGLFERMNCHDTTCISVEVMGHTLRLAQDPTSGDLGTTVWDASIVIAKLFEKNIRKGEFSRTKWAGKRVLELGAGMGLGGMALALMDADVTSTDMESVLPLLKRNCDTNLGTGKIKVAPLDWTIPEHIPPLNPPFDLVIAADCIYHEDAVPIFHKTVMEVTDYKSTVIVANELRSQTIQNRFLEVFSSTHNVKRVPTKQMHETYQHPLIQIFVCKKKRPRGAAKDGEEDGDEGQEEETKEAEPGAAAAAAATDMQGAGPVAESVMRDSSSQAAQPDTGGAGKQGGEESWQARRLGAAMAQLMSDVKVPNGQEAG